VAAGSTPRQPPGRAAIHFQTSLLEVKMSENLYLPLQTEHDNLIRKIKNLRGYRELEIPSEFSYLKGIYGAKELEWKAFAFAAEGIIYGRIVLIEGVDSWINNIIVYPEDGYAVPILGIEMLGFRHRIHLIVADIFPLLDADKNLMDEIGMRYDGVGDTPPMPDWATKIFSRAPVFRKPRNTEDIQTAADAMCEVGEKWLHFAESAKPLSESDLATRICQKRDEYISHHAEDEPAKPFLTRTFGEETGLRLVNEFLFPQTWEIIRSKLWKTNHKSAS
jgi:hypothetical protein